MIKTNYLRLGHISGKRMDWTPYLIFVRGMAFPGRHTTSG
jgi:hypothetical protein